MNNWAKTESRWSFFNPSSPLVETVVMYRKSLRVSIITSLPGGGSGANACAPLGAL